MQIAKKSKQVGESAPSKKEQAGRGGVHLARGSKQVGGSAPSKKEQACCLESLNHNILQFVQFSQRVKKDENAACPTMDKSEASLGV